MPGIGARCTGRIIADMTAVIVFISGTISERRLIMGIMIIIITILILITHTIHFITMIIITGHIQVIHVIIMVLTQTFPTIDFDQTQDPELLKTLTL